MLSVKDKMTLDLEAVAWRYDGSKEVEIRHLFDEHAAAYYNRLQQLLDNADALAYAPMLVKRLQRLRELRRGARSGAAGDHVPSDHVGRRPGRPAL